MHRVDYSKEADAAHGHGGPMSGGGTSSYMTDLADKLALVKDEIFASYRVGDLAKEWCVCLSASAICRSSSSCRRPLRAS